MNVYAFIAGLISGMNSCAQRRYDEQRTKEHRELMDLLRQRPGGGPGPCEPRPIPEPEPPLTHFCCACGQRFTFDDDYILKHWQQRLKVTCNKCGQIKWIKEGRIVGSEDIDSYQAPGL